MRFRAFLSYSHADAAWARWLLRRLETYRVPSRLVGTETAHGRIERRLGSFFLDRDELPTAGDLGVTIRDALADSVALIVLCSPAAAGSRWVNAEVDSFRSSGRSDRVLCFVVAGVPGSTDPALQCFPPALLRADAQGVVHEPLAADARREGDGRERAFLKLVAGLLGVGYDALAQREAQRRTRKMAVVAAASLAGMAVALGLAAMAYVARDDAQRRQAQAEDILGFMLGDLRKNLSTVGRLDLMRSVDDKATRYFATLDPRDMSDRGLEEQARSLTGIGEVRLAEGNHEAAMAAFREAHARTAALYQRAPEKGQRLFDLAQAEYWIGFVEWQQGRLDEAQAWLSRYRNSAARLAAMDRGNFVWQRELAYGFHNLAVLDESRGRIASAKRAFKDELVLYRAWLQQHPDDTALRFEASNVVSWLGTIASRQGRLEEAERFMAEQVEGMQRNIVAEPQVAEWRVLHLDALLLQAQIQAKRGRRESHLSTLVRALPLAEVLARQDPANIGWQVSLGIAKLMQAQSLEEADPEADALAKSATSILQKAYAAEPKNERVLRFLAMAHHCQARQAIARGNLHIAKQGLADAVDLLMPAWHASPNEALRQIVATNLILAGRVAAMESDQPAARASWKKARDMLIRDAGVQVPFDRLDPLARTLYYLGLQEQVTAHLERLDAAGYVPQESWPWPQQSTFAGH